MRVYWQMRCDEGHGREVIDDDGGDVPPADLVCPSGHEAVTLARQPAADLAVVTLEPAARVVDSVTGRLGLERRYFLVVSDLATGRRTRAIGMVSDREAPDQVQRLLGRTYSEAVEMLSRLRSSAYQ